MSNKYNQRRKKILLDIDNGKNFDIEELAMYDLTPYFKEVEEPNLYETIILNKNKQRKVLMLVIIYFFHHHSMMPCLF